MNEREKTYSHLENLFGKSYQNLKIINDKEEFYLEADKVFLSYILDELDISLTNITSRTTEEELFHWDRKFLGDLAVNLGSFTKNSSDKDKLSYLVRNSITTGA